MQISIRNWPPLASHLTCLFLGLFISNMSRPSCNKPILKKNAVFISIDKDFLEKKAYLGNYLIAIKKTLSAKDFCYESRQTFRLVQQDNFITIETKVENLDYSSKVFSKNKNIIYKLTPQQHIYNYTKCTQTSQVYYGL
jgi:hypothetical protein